ncbi:hypothetical protein FDA94_28785 [Herbidospora galbida]|uniref:Antirestriction protein ArdA n=1 Tax=Herbidospora galbida TaxID=2575442 RepID=A0A4U3M6R9_9ACTN|nr:antirestriction protein ArdA [Herbidospora galbida]TKK84628.1 hypothetical protein FDA94_28785 [Herbidospora galbida]
MDFEITLIDLNPEGNVDHVFNLLDDDLMNDVNAAFGDEGSNEDAKEGVHFKVGPVNGMEPLYDEGEVPDASFAEILRAARLAAQAKDESWEGFLAWVDDTGGGLRFYPDDDEALKTFRKQFRGEYEDLEEYAKEWAEDQGAPEAMFGYMDWDGFGVWLATDYNVIDLPSGNIAIFTK